MIGGVLRRAAENIDTARCQAVLRADRDTAKRLLILQTRVLVEAEYADNISHGMSKVQRRALPPGATIGWLMRHCAATRETRRALGVSVPDVEHVDILGLKGLAA